MDIPKIFLSSRFDTNALIEKNWLETTRCRHRCFTFANTGPGQMYFNSRLVEALKTCEETPGVELMMDSGAHSIHRIANSTSQRSGTAAKKQSMNLEQIVEKMFQDYAKYCKKNQKKWDFFLTLDWKMHQPTIFAMQQKFAEKGLMPVPVFHGDDSFDWIQKYVDMGCKLICVGTKLSYRGKGRRGKKFYYGLIFELAAKLGIQLHGLAVTNLQLMTSYPWYSVDSSTWTRNACFGAILVPNPEKNTIDSIHVSPTYAPAQDSYNHYPPKQRQMIDKLLAQHGFDIHEMRDPNLGSDARHDWNGYIYSNLDKMGVDFEKQNRMHVSWERLL